MNGMTIVAFGDSITMDTHVEDETKRWLSVLQDMLSRQYPTINFKLINSGVGGHSDREKMTRYERDVLAHNPDVLLVQFGGNNSGYIEPERAVSTQETDKYLQQIKDTISPETELVIITFPYVLWSKHQFFITDPEGFNRFYEARGGHDASVNQYREVVKAFAARNGYLIVDLYKAMKETTDIESLQVGDGVHLNAAGDELLAQLVFGALDKIIDKSHHKAIQSDALSSCCG